MHFWKYCLWDLNSTHPFTKPKNHISHHYATLMNANKPWNKTQIYSNLWKTATGLENWDNNIIVTGSMAGQVEFSQSRVTQCRKNVQTVLFWGSTKWKASKEKRASWDTPFKYTTVCASCLHLQWKVTAFTILLGKMFLDLDLYSTHPKKRS